ncbi:HEAT repeat domain-containing protein [Methylomonas sp. HYX-M1]|uniref:HEAT repeat domain-containing protein n=1 Tax=Methylomonas sp. HYX-M1 TaxID=3139307 RepID=UPI00345BFCC3
MERKQLYIGLTLVLAAAVIVVPSAFWASQHWSEIQRFFGLQEAQTQEAAEANPALDPAAMQERLEAAQNYQASEEDAAEEAQADMEQIEEAGKLLADASVEQRVAAIEQLSAYPSPKSEQLMRAALQQDKAEAVRAAAADYLSYIEVPTRETVEALSQALLDGNEEVRDNALNTLQYYAGAVEDDDPVVKMVFEQLKIQQKNKKVVADIREAIQEFLADETAQ